MEEWPLWEWVSPRGQLGNIIRQDSYRRTHAFNQSCCFLAETEAYLQEFSKFALVQHGRFHPPQKRSYPLFIRISVKLEAKSRVSASFWLWLLQSQSRVLAVWTPAHWIETFCAPKGHIGMYHINPSTVRMSPLSNQSNENDILLLSHQKSEGNVCKYS